MEREGATPAREEPPRSRSWQVASSVATALKLLVQDDLREIDIPGLFSAGETDLFIYLARDFLFFFFIKINSSSICIENFHGKLLSFSIGAIELKSNELNCMCRNYVNRWICEGFREGFESIEEDEGRDLVYSIFVSFRVFFHLNHYIWND